MHRDELACLRILQCVATGETPGRVDTRAGSRPEVCHGPRCAMVRGVPWSEVCHGLRCAMVRGVTSVVARSWHTSVVARSWHTSVAPAVHVICATPPRRGGVYVIGATGCTPTPPSRRRARAPPPTGDPPP